LAAATIVIIALSPAMAAAQTSSMSNVDTAMSFMDRLNGIMDVCAEQAQSNVALFTPCMNIINDFNNHMTQLFEEEQNDMAQILLAGNQ
jgi:hypothetical protein